MDDVVLRDLADDDAGWIAEACQDPEIQRWTFVPRPYTREHAAQFIRDHGGDLRVWVIADRATNRGVGVIGIHRIDADTGEADVGYWVAPWGRRRGAATAALVQLVNIVAAIPQAHSVSARIAETNVASRAVAEQAGFTEIGAQPDLCPDGECRVTGVTYRRNITTTVHQSATYGRS